MLKFTVLLCFVPVALGLLLPMLKRVITDFAETTCVLEGDSADSISRLYSLATVYILLGATGSLTGGSLMPLSERVPTSPALFRLGLFVGLIIAALSRLLSQLVGVSVTGRLMFVLALAYGVGIVQYATDPRVLTMVMDLRVRGVFPELPFWAVTGSFACCIATELSLYCFGKWQAGVSPDV